MKLGFFTACLPSWTLEQVADYAVGQGYQCLEVAVWPAQPGRDFEAPHLPVATWSGADVDATLGLLERTGLEISSLGYYENNLIGDPGRREEIRAHLKACIDVAQSLGVPSMGTFIGRDPALSVVENMAVAERIFPELVDYAGERDIKLMIENCVMEGWHPDGYPGNIAYSPELWDWMATKLGLYLNWDPSHLAWIGIDPVETILPYAASIVHVQAKDVELSIAQRNRYGFYGAVQKGDNPWHTGWWRYRVPGRGSVDWLRVVDRLYEAGFQGTVSVEHEDPMWGGTPEKVTEGLRIAYETLRPLIGDVNA